MLLKRFDTNDPFVRLSKRVCQFNYEIGGFSSHVPVEEGHPQVLAGRLAAEARLLPHRGFSPAALAPDLEGMGGAQVEGVLAVLAAQGIGGLVEAPDLLRPQRVLEEGVLDEPIRRQIEKDICCVRNVTLG